MAITAHPASSAGLNMKRWVIYASHTTASLKEMSAMGMEAAHRRVENGHASAQNMLQEIAARPVKRALFSWKVVSAYKKNAQATARSAMT